MSFQKWLMFFNHKPLSGQAVCEFEVSDYESDLDEELELAYYHTLANSAALA